VDSDATGGANDQHVLERLYPRTTCDLVWRRDCIADDRQPRGRRADLGVVDGQAGAARADLDERLAGAWFGDRPFLELEGHADLVQHHRSH
jgi:hypothetical protein